MRKQNQLVRQTITVLMACGLIATLLPGFTAAQEEPARETLIARAGAMVPLDGPVLAGKPVTFRFKGDLSDPHWDLGDGATAADGFSADGGEEGGRPEDGSIAGDDRTDADGEADAGGDDGQGPQITRLEVSSDGRHFVKQDGSPFFWIGDTAWWIMHILDKDKIDFYLTTRAEQGFTVIQFCAAPKLHSNEANQSGHRPCNGPITESDANLNEDYWELVDYLIDKCRSLGMYVALVPEWSRKSVEDGTIDTSNCARFADTLAQRYEDRENVVWMVTQDVHLDNQRYADVARCYGNAIKAVGGNQLVTAHTVGGKPPGRYFQKESWFDFSAYQGSHDRKDDYLAADLAAEDWARTPAKPTVNAEAAYEQHAWAFDPAKGFIEGYFSRQQGYFSVFTGATGYTYGHNNIFRFYGEPLGSTYWGPDLRWDDDRVLNSETAISMGFFRELMESRPLLERAPDNAFVTNQGQPGPDYKPALVSTAKSYALVYLPYGGSVTVDLEKLSGSHVVAWWFNPLTGTSSQIGTYPRGKTRTFTAPDSGGTDWVLVIDDASMGFAAPGS
jgi:hypothetical protein